MLLQCGRGGSRTLVSPGRTRLVTLTWWLYSRSIASVAPVRPRQRESVDLRIGLNGHIRLEYVSLDNHGVFLLIIDIASSLLRCQRPDTMAHKISSFTFRRDRP
jgi:hypothetical protein